MIIRLFIGGSSSVDPSHNTTSTYTVPSRSCSNTLYSLSTVLKPLVPGISIASSRALLPSPFTEGASTYAIHHPTFSVSSKSNALPLQALKSIRLNIYDLDVDALPQAVTTTASSDSLICLKMINGLHTLLSRNSANGSTL